MDSLGPLILVLPLAGGYTFLRACHYTQFRWDSQEWERNLFEATLAGTALFVAARLVAVELERHADFVRLRDAVHAGAPIPFIGTFVAAVAIALVVAFAVNLAIPRTEASRRVARRHGGELRVLLHDAAESGLPVSLTMENRKVYVGFVLHAPAPRDRETRLLPTVTGHREPDSLRVVFDTKYWDVYEDVLAREADPDAPELDVEDFGIVLPLERIRSANLFDDDTYRRHFEQRRGSKGDGREPAAG